MHKKIYKKSNYVPTTSSHRHAPFRELANASCWAQRLRALHTIDRDANVVEKHDSKTFRAIALALDEFDVLFFVSSKMLFGRFHFVTEL